MSKQIQIKLDGIVVSAYEGESLVAVLLRQGTRIFTQANVYHLSRTIFCGMGLCHQCLVTIDGVRDIRACMTTIRPEMNIQTTGANPQALTEIEVDLT